MIHEISAKDFKGQTFNQPLERFNLFVGNNGCGKSARSQAIQLLLTGYIQGASKVAHQIVSNFSSGGFTVSGNINNTEYERKYSTSKAGNTSTMFRINKRRSDKTEFTQKTEKFPVCFDLKAFIELSDVKKTDYIFSILPDSESVRLLDEKTEKAHAELNNKIQNEKNIRLTLQRLSEAHAKYDVSGDILSINQEIDAAEKELAAIQADIAKQKISQVSQEPSENPLQKIMGIIEKTCGTSCSVFQVAKKLMG